MSTRSVAVEALPGMLAAEQEILVDLENDPYFRDQTDTPGCEECATAVRAAGELYGTVMEATIGEGWVTVWFDGVCANVKFPVGHLLAVEGKPADWPVPGTRCPGIDGVVVASVVYIDDERGLFHTVLSVNDTQPRQHYLVGVYEALADGTWRLDPTTHYECHDEVPNLPGRYPNIVPAVAAYEEYGGGY